jgi:hypothetical protein
MASGIPSPKDVRPAATPFSPQHLESSRPSKWHNLASSLSPTCESDGAGHLIQVLGMLGGMPMELMVVVVVVVVFGGGHGNGREIVATNTFGAWRRGHEDPWPREGIKDVAHSGKSSGASTERISSSSHTPGERKSSPDGSKRGS